MKRIASILAALVLATLLTACGQGNEKKVVTTKQLMKETQDVLQTLEAYMQQQKEEYQKGAEGQLAKFDRRIAKLQARAASAEEQAKAGMEKQLAALGGKKQAVVDKLEKMKAAGAEAWEDMKSGVNAAIADLENEYDKVVDKL